MNTLDLLAPIISYSLNGATFIIGVLFLAIPNDTINILMPCIFQSSDNDNVTAMEQILTRLLGAVFIAYSMNSITFMCDNKRRNCETMRPASDDTVNASNESTNRKHTQSSHRIVLSSPIYLGMNILLVLVFEMSLYEFPSDMGCDNNLLGDDVFINLLVVASVFVIFGLIGMIASFFPASGDDNLNANVRNPIGTSSSSVGSKCCSCWRKKQTVRWESPSRDTEANIDNEESYIDVTPLLSNENSHSDANTAIVQNSSDDWDNQPPDVGVSQETLNHQDNLHSEGRITGSRRLLKMAGPHSLYIFVGCFVLLVRLPFSLSIPHFISVTLGALARSEYDQAKLNILLLFIFGTLDAALDFFCVFLFGLANLKISRGIRIDLFMAILRQEIGFFDQIKSGDLASRLNSDCGEMASDLTWFFRFSIESVVRIVGIVLYMFLRAPKLAVCAVSVVPIVAIVNKRYGDWLSKNAKDVQTALAQANSVAQEALLNIRCVIAFASEHVEQKKYNDKIDEHYKLNVKQLYATGFYYMIISTFLINTCIQALLLYVGMLLIKHEEMSPDVLLAFMLYQSGLQNEVMNLFNSFTSLLKSSGAGDKVFQLLDRNIRAPGTGSRENVSIMQQNSAKLEDLGDINITNVTFFYPSRPNDIVLRDLSLNIPAGKTVALIGKSGCGKSTIFSLLQRFYDPNAGVISISAANESNLKDLHLINYRNSIGIVTQDPVLFSGSIKSNISYCVSENISDDEIIEAAKLASAHTFIENFPNKYDTQVGERGVQLSGGQKQRLCIARAIISKPKLLLLDEATSALDAESETVVHEALDRLLERRDMMTTIIIAHRLSTIRNADKIVVIDKGQVVEQGTHDTLIADTTSKYYLMVQQAERSNKTSVP